MCLYVDKKRTEKFLEDNKNKEFVYCYKIVRVFESSNLWGDITQVNSPYFKYEWNPGKHESDSKIEHSNVNFIPQTIVNQSFHFFVKEEDAKKYFEKEMFSVCYHKIIKVKCFMDSFVAAGYNSPYYPLLTNVAFRKVELSQEEYDKCFTT
jgi:hypothetical protein